MSEDKVHRATRWKLFYDEDGGLKDMLEEIRTAYLSRMSAVEPWEAGKLSKLAIANRIAQELDGLIRAIIDDGKLASHRDAHIKRIEDMPEAKRRWF